ncbi:MAG: TolC family protein [Bacteroidia bacterium]|nr:TolC family protein [Bacteroidia bacterium]
MKVLLITLLGFLLVPEFLISQDSLSLEKAISLGIENNYGIRIADKSILIAENNNSWARAGRTPTVDLNGQFSNTLINDNNEASFLQGTYYSGGLGGSLDAQWLLFAGGRVGIAKDQLSQLVDQQKLLKEETIHNLLKDIIQNYHDVLLQQSRLEIMEELYRLSLQRLEYEETRKEFGSSNEYNLIQFEEAVITDSINLVNQRTMIDISIRNLLQNLKVYRDEDYYAINDDFDVIAESLDIERLHSTLEESNYTLKSLSVIYQLDQLNTRLEESTLKPVISLNGSVGYSRNAFNFFKDNPNTREPFDLIMSNRINGTLSANLNWNIYDGGVKNQNVENAKLQEEISALTFEEAKFELKNQLDILYKNYNNQLELLELSEIQLLIAAKNLNITNERFKSGQINSLDFRAVQNQYLNAGFNRLNAIYNVIITKSEIDWLVGSFAE